MAQRLTRTCWILFLVPRVVLGQGSATPVEESLPDASARSVLEAPPTEHDTLIIGYWTDEMIFSPAWGSPARHLMFEPLFRGNYTNPGDVLPALVTRWEPSDDYRTWTYHLRTDVRWHDGVPLTAHDVKFTQDLRQHPAVSHRMSPGSQVVQVVDDSTFQITYVVPMNPTPWLGVWPRHLLQDLDPETFWEWDFWREPIGSGPYRYVRRTDGQRMEVEANSDYYGTQPSIEHVIFRLDVWTTLNSLAGGVDAFGGPVDLEPEFQNKNPDYRVYTWEQPATGIAICWNQRNPLFERTAVRHALTMAIDRRELSRLRGYPDSAYARDVLAPAYPGGFDRGPATVFDQDEARRILAQERWVDSDGDGIRDRDGLQFRFTVMVSAAGRDLEAVSQVQQYLSQVGVRMEIEAVARRRTVREALESGQTDAGILRVSLGSLARLVGEDSPIGLDDSELAEHLEAAHGSWNPEVRRHHLGKALVRFREVLPVTMLFADVQSSVAHKKVKGLRSPDRGDVVEFLNELWIER